MKNTFLSMQDKRRRLGITSVALTVLIVVVLLLAVLVGDALEHRFALRADYSFNGITTLDRITIDALSNLSKDIHIHALFTPGQEDQALIGLLDRYAAASQHITYSMENLLTNPMLVNSFSDLPEDNPVTTDSLVVHSPDTGRTRVLDGTNYIAQSYDTETGAYAITGLTYEKSLTEAILFVTSDTLPAIKVLTGHGELAGDNIAPMVNVLADANFEVSSLNLLSGQTLDAGDILFVLSPSRDLLAQERDTIRGFVHAGGSMLITSDYDAPEQLPGFAALYQMFGFALKPGIVVAEADAAGSYYETPAYLMPYMQQTTMTADLIAAGRTTLIMPGARAFDITGAAMQTQLEEVLRSGPAYIKNADDAVQSLDWQEGDEKGAFALALFSSLETEQGRTAHAFAIGSSATLTDGWLQTNTYSVELLMQALRALGARPTISLDIAQKQAIRAPLVLGDTVLPGILLAAAPLAVIVPAWFMYRSRRRKA